MIAELNSIVPSFRVTADAPTMSPLQPHFDAASNNVSYWLHWQPQWGLRIKGAKKDSAGSDGTILPSDEKVEWSLPELNEQLQVINIKNKTLDGAIYYNKAGFDPQKRTVYSGDIEDAIRVEPTGKSGAKYNDHNGIGAAASTSVQPDIQEISIMLPSIGNTIANVWDLVYGYKEEDGLTRNLDIAWGSTEGVRMITEREGGSGFDYDEDTYISTVAGAINSVHDLMGQFVITSAGIPENGLDKADEMIYYNLQDGKFYRKFITYDYDIKTDLGAITNDEKYALIGNLINYEKNKYWVNREAENYYLSTMDNFYDFRNYYNITKEEQTLSFEYKKQDLYYKDGYSYIQESADSPISGRNYKNITPTTVTTYFYEQGKFYLQESSTRYVLDNRTDFDPSAKYYIVTGGKDQTTTVWNEAEQAWETKTIKIGGTAQPATVNAISFDVTNKNNKNGYYKGNSKKYTLLTEDDVTDRTKSYTVYTLKITEATKNYAPGTYYYEDANHNFIKDMSESGDENKIYYLITPTPVDRFYKPDTYYYKNGSEYVLDTSTTVQDKEYYERKKLYVEEDTTGRFPTGME